LEKRRVVVTGVGMVSPIGIGTQDNWTAICESKSGIGEITYFDTTNFPVKIAGEVKNFDPLLFVDKKDVKKMDYFIHFALGASTFALDDAALKITDQNAERVGVAIGSGIGGLPSIERQHMLFLEKGHKKISPFFIPGIIVNLASGQVSIKFGAKGPNTAACTACSTGTHAIGDSFRIIARGEADVMITGGTEGEITPLAVGGFSAMKALSTRNDEPTRASRPFDRERDGFVVGEGAGILVLEALHHALDRGADIYAEVVGYGMSADAFHISAPPPDGEGAQRVMRNAIEDAQIEPSAIDYINAHGTSTPFNDRIETQAIKLLFKEHAAKLAVSSTKSMIGHLLGASGGVEAAVTALAIKHQIMPPTINYEFPDPDCDLDYVPNKHRPARIDYALSNSFGFGGTNATLILKRFEE
jgi:3-oxoacyl-[acyl-carrier-protein] synthase II